MSRSAPPQSRDEIEPIERELRRLDDDLRIEWEPRAVLVTRGRYDALGKMTEPVYDGRWKIVKKHDPNRTAMWREDALVTYVTAPVTAGYGEKKVYAMTADGPYAPVGWWLVEHMRSWDRANRDFVNRMRATLDEWNDEADRRRDEAAVAGEEQALDAMWFNGTMRGGVSVFHPVTTNLTTE